MPFALLRETVDARFTDGTIEIFHKGKRIASHVRSRAHKHTTIPEHMPSSHRRYAEWSPARMLREAEKIGPATIALFEAIMKAKPHPEQGFRSCLGILSLVKSYGPERIEAAAKRGNDIRATTDGSIKSILQNALDRAFGKPSTPEPPRSGTPTSAGVATTTEQLPDDRVPREARKRQHARKRCGRKDEKRNDTCFHIPHTIG